MLVNSNTFNIESTLEKTWNSGHKTVVNLEALSAVEDWKVEISLPDGYEVAEIYNAEITQENGKSYLSGGDGNNSLEQGSSTKVVLIVNEENSNSSEPSMPQFLFSDTVGSSLEAPDSDCDESFDYSSESNSHSSSSINASSQIAEDWVGGYKLDIEVSAESQADNWQLNFNSPHEIQGVYGVDLVDNGNGNYTISGQNDQVNLSPGQTIEPVLIMNDGGGEAIAPELMMNDGSVIETPTPVEAAPMEAAPVEAAPVEAAPMEAAPMENEVSEPPSANNNFGSPIPADANVISVDNDFGGDLKSAIASANDGQVVQLGGNTYYASEITIDKDITIDGQEGTIIDGGGTSESIVYLNEGATGATIQDIEITNGNNGIFGQNANNLTLQNLNVNNIGINQTIQEGQNNTGIVLGHAEGLQLLNSIVSNIGRNGVSIGDTDGATISGINVQDVNLAAQHAQSHDAAGIKFFNTNAVVLKDSYFANINAMHIWNDTTNGTVLDNNTVVDVGSDFLAPSFNTNVDISGIYNEKSSNSIVKNNVGTAIEGFNAYNATEFTTETMTLENNDFSSTGIGTTDYWVNESAEKLIAVTEDPYAADYSLFAGEYEAQLNIS